MTTENKATAKNKITTESRAIAENSLTTGNKATAISAMMEYDELDSCTIGVLCERWKNAVRYQVKPSTYACYSTVVQKHIQPEIGDLPIGQLNNEILIYFIRRKQREGLSGNTLRLIIFVMKRICRMANESGWTTAEPLNYYMPKGRGNSMRLMSQEDFKALIHHLMKVRNDFDLGLLVSLCTGIRVGELCGLKWNDIDLNRGVLHIRRTVSRIKKTELLMDSGELDESLDKERRRICQEAKLQEGLRVRKLSERGEEALRRRQEAGQEAKTILYIGTPKTGTSMRDIPLSDFLVEKLRQKSQGWLQETSFYILTGSSKCMEPRGVQRRFKNLLRKKGIPDVNIHSLRHSFASQWIENGFDSKALSEILGHSSVKITMDIYVHSNMNQKKAYMNQMVII